MTKKVIDDDVYEIPENPSKVEQLIYDWVVDGFGYSEAEDPSWNITYLAEWINENLSKEDYEPMYRVQYRLEDEDPDDYDEEDDDEDSDEDDDSDDEEDSDEEI